MTTSNESKGEKKSGLWKDGFGAVGAFLKALEDAGGTTELLKIARSNPTVAEAMVKAGNEFLRNLHADEELPSSYAYPKDYAVKPLAEQIALLSKIFGLDGTSALIYSENLPELPEGAEGWFAVLRWQLIAKTYTQAIETMFSLIKTSRTFKNWREGQIAENSLRRSKRTERMFAELCEQQKGDLLLIPSQFGLRHRGRSVLRACEVFDDNEFGLGAFAISSMLLTHPEREQVREQLHVECAGDEFDPLPFDPESEDNLLRVPIFYWHDGELCFGSRHTVHASEKHGSVSGFIPKN